MLDPTESASGNSDCKGTVLEARIDSLRNLLLGALAGLLLLAIGVDVFMFRQLSMVRKDLEAVRPVVADYQLNKEPLLNRLVTGLQNHARTHPDILPLLERYGIPQATNAPAPVGSSVSPVLPAPAKR